MSSSLNVATFRHHSLPRTFFVVGLLAIGLLIAGCSSTGKGSKSGEAGDGLSEAELNAEREARFGEGGIPTAEGDSAFRGVQFDFDSSAINSIGRQNIEFNAELLRENPDLRVVLEGHADERGTREYNLALGARRAQSVRSFLSSRGIDPSRMRTISYGKERPVAVCNDISCWSQNRRAVTVLNASS